MQFKHPELLWALLLLLIPIVIHLFQLRRFKKTPFTNVKFLKKVVSESRRSNTLKKWLLLFTRMAMLAALVIAFAQPFFAEKSALKDRETVIYLDNSFSMQAKSDRATLLENGIQSLIESVPRDRKFTLFTNDKVFREVALPEVQNDLLAIAPTAKQLQLQDIYLKGATFFREDAETDKHLVIVSDFQRRMGSRPRDSSENMVQHWVPLIPDEQSNVAVDSVYFNNQNSENIELTAIISSKGSMENIPVSLFNGDQLIAKTAAVLKDDNKAEVVFSLPNSEVINGKIEVSDSGLLYDNHLYFNIAKKQKIKVLAIGGTETDYLKRIYSNEEFDFTASTLKNLNYGSLGNHNFVVLNGLESVPTALANSLRAFTKEGGSIAVIPKTEIDINSYNVLTSNYFSTSFTQKVEQQRKVTNIAFSHPLFRNVFDRNVTNFEYPSVSQYFTVKTIAASALAFQDNAPFLIGNDSMYLFTAALSSENSNFKNSPLIVPTFYNMASNSLRLPSLYGILGNTFSIDVSARLPDDTILKVSKGNYEFIPQQQALSNKVALTFDDNLKEDGIYHILKKEDTLGTISFNYDRDESVLEYMNTDDFQGISRASSIASLFDGMEKDSRITVLWKWFVILALVFLLLEALIQKFIA